MKRMVICSIVLFFIAGPFYMYARADVKGDKPHGRPLEEVLEETLRPFSLIGEQKTLMDSINNNQIATSWTLFYPLTNILK